MSPARDMAAFIRGVMNMATVPSNDGFQQNLRAAKNWLEAIARGDLVVAKAEVKQAEATPDVKAPANDA